MTDKGEKQQKNILQKILKFIKKILKNLKLA